MKRLISVLLALVMLLSIFSLTSFAVGEETTSPILTDGAKVIKKLKEADVDLDGSYSTEDARKVLEAAAGIISDKNTNYDINKDKLVSVADAQKMLRIAAGIDSVATQEELLTLFNEKMNGIKATDMVLRPNFSKASKIQCTSIKVTTTGAPLPGLNVTNMEYNNYVNTIEKETKKLLWMLPEKDKQAMKVEIAKMKQSAVDSYKPQTNKENVLKDSSSFNHKYPIYALNWVSKLTLSDISGISCKYIDGEFILQIKMPQYKHIGDEYPSGATGFAERQNLPYGKIFTLTNFDESDGSRINSMTLKNGCVTVNLNSKTEKPVYTNYKYTYIADISAPNQDGITMKTVTTANLEESFSLSY